MEKLPCDLLVKAGTLVTQDSDRRVLTDAALALSEGKILAVGPDADIASRYRPGDVLDLSGDIVLPGLINAHTHVPMTVFRGLEDDLALLDWLENHIWPAESRLNERIVRLGALLACAEMLRFGCTTFLDLYLFEEQTALAARSAGIRAVVGEGVFHPPTASYATTEQAFARVDSLLRLLEDDPLVRPCLVAHSVYATGKDELLKLGDMARTKGLTLTLHAAETTDETAVCLERFGKRPVDMLRDLGLLGPNLLVAHAVDITPDEIDLLAATETRVAHNPRSNMKLGSGTAPVAAMRAAGVTVGLGTDGAASNNALNMFAEMAAAALLAKVGGDPTALPARDALDMATVDGAKAVGLRDVGSLAPGFRADLTALRGDSPNLNPLYDAPSHLVYAASGGEVRLTMVEGKVVYRDGVYAGIDFPGLLAEMDDIKAWARDKS
ncbi:amidohydrolase [Fundidesulfovibrio butyratiphilus]